ncbi:hypothetical protein B0H34DRAFT_204926 [Crassisporium funariophilum]|nr:hypothetical protein B0H34DRAFT_204926 [Crassisporium funariophilum]
MIDLTSSCTLLLWPLASYRPSSLGRSCIPEGAPPVLAPPARTRPGDTLPFGAHLWIRRGRSVSGFPLL